MSNVTLLPGVCPQVTFNCTAVYLPSTTLRWFINDDIIASYPYHPNHQFPYNEILTSSPWTDVVIIQIVEASWSDSSLDRANFYSTLTANLSAVRELGGENVTCGSTGTRSNTIELNFNFKGKFESITNCSYLIFLLILFILLFYFFYSTSCNAAKLKVSMASISYSCSSSSITLLLLLCLHPWLERSRDHLHVVLILYSSS